MNMKSYLQMYERGSKTKINNNSSKKNRNALPRFGTELILE
jgi:hypothetical protein